MSKIKKMLGVLMAAMLCFALTPIAAFAAETDQITLEMEGAASGHTYSVYQLLTGKVSAGKLINAEFGKNVNQGTKDACQNSVETFFNNYIDGKVDQALGTSLKSVVDGTAPVHEFSGDGSWSTATGYYLIVDSTNPDDVDDALSRYIVAAISGNNGVITIKPKASTPTIDKKIVNEAGKNEPTADGKANQAAIGDTVNYELKGLLPNTTGYSEYTYLISDTLSAGLTLVQNSFAYAIGDKDAAIDARKPLDAKYVILKFTDNDFTVSVDVKAMQADEIYAVDSDYVYVTYDATLNENAVIGNAGNPNTVKLTYSNNPANSANKKTTPEVETLTYTTQVKVTKVDGDNGNAPLKGATFELTGTNLNKVLVKIGENGTATLYGEGTENVKIEAKVGEDGVLYFQGLNQGEYKLVEVEAPAGYNKILDPISFTISFDNTNAQKWTVTGEGFDADGTGLIATDVVNKSGLELPSTGGIGTTIFYIVGGILVVGAIAFLIVRRRANSTK